MTIDNTQLTVRNSEESDLVLLKKWLLEPGILRWFPMVNEYEVDDAIRIWKSYIPKRSAFTMTYRDIPCGMVVLYLNSATKTAHQTLFAIIVDESYRKMGIGTSLMTHVIRQAKENFKIELLHLEVYEGNPGISLYEKLGFTQYGVHPRFLKEPSGEYLAKILMQKML